MKQSLKMFLATSFLPIATTVLKAILEILFACASEDLKEKVLGLLKKFITEASALVKQAEELVEKLEDEEEELEAPDLEELPHP